VVDLVAQGAALLIELVEEPLEYFALARVIRHEVPKVTHLSLADPVDSSEALLDAIRVPGKVVVDHEVRPLEVDTLPGRVGRDEHEHVFVLDERLLYFSPLLARQPPMDGHDRFRAPEKGPQLVD